MTPEDGLSLLETGSMICPSNIAGPVRPEPHRDQIAKALAAATCHLYDSFMSARPLAPSAVNRRPLAMML